MTRQYTILHHKTIILGVSVLVMMGIVFLLVYKNTSTSGYISDAIPTTTPSEDLTEDQQEIGDIYQKIQPAFAEHMALTSDNIIWFTNYYRTQNGLTPLQLSQKLRNSAYYKSMDMFKYHYFAHYRPGNNLGFDNFVDNQKYSFIKIAENLAQGDFTTSKEIVDRWMQSPEHRRNILDPAYVEIGVSVDSGILEGIPTTLITQHFGKPSTSCPVVNTKLYTQIKKMNDQLITLKKKIDTDEGDDTVITELITQYNTLIKQRASIVSQYNDQVIQFDTCIAKG